MGRYQFVHSLENQTSMIEKQLSMGRDLTLRAAYGFVSAQREQK
jgi:hypothetical protein